MPIPRGGGGAAGLERPVLFIGYGNPGRLDDGLGPAFCGAVEAGRLSGVETRTAMQLNVEEAAEVGRFATVVFVDAAVPDGHDFTLEGVGPDPGRVAFSSHTSSPEAVMGVATALFHARPTAWKLAIRGARFGGFGEGLSPVARAHLDAALAFVRLWLATPRPADAAAPDGGTAPAASRAPPSEAGPPARPAPLTPGATR